jgi:hypothetical protein
MKRHQIASLIILSTILSFILLATACGAEPTAPTPSVTPTLSVTDTDN